MCSGPSTWEKVVGCVRLTWNESWITSVHRSENDSVLNVTCRKWWNSSMWRRFARASTSGRGFSSRAGEASGVRVPGVRSAGVYGFTPEREHLSRRFSQLLHGAFSSHCHLVLIPSSYVVARRGFVGAWYGQGYKLGERV